MCALRLHTIQKQNKSTITLYYKMRIIMSIYVFNTYSSIIPCLYIVKKISYGNIDMPHATICLSVKEINGNKPWAFG